MTNDALVAKTAFLDWRDLKHSALTIQSRDKLTIAHICAGKDKQRQVSAAIHAAYGETLPENPKCVSMAHGVDVIWAGPNQWLAVADRDGERDLEKELAPLLEGLAAVTDQSDARSVVRVGGTHARSLLAKGVPIDLDPRAFAPRSAALTHASHIGVMLWQVDDTPTYDLAVFRSFADSFAGWLRSAAAEWAD